ncbi:MAG: hypothetical protein HOP30_10195 [Cyclobacteriaceae bacterium]|nr:hypothetical protein [Cyclobacteriaceae bacterium]
MNNPKKKTQSPKAYKNLNTSTNIDEETIFKYMELIDSISGVIKSKNLVKDELLKKAKFPRATFFRKIDGRVWKKGALEVLKLAKEINR